MKVPESANLLQRAQGSVVLRAAVSVVIALSTTVVQARSPYQTTNAGLVFGGGNLGTAEPIYWLDNERALFPGYEPLRVDGAPDRRLSAPGLYVWNIKTGVKVRHADLQAPIWTLCFNEGYVFYSVAGDHSGQQKSILAGRFGAEKPLDASVPWKEHPELQQCEAYPRQDPRAEARTWLLRPGDGYITAGGRRNAFGEHIYSENQNEPATLHQADGGARTLPVLSKELSYSATFTYSPYAKSYILVPHTWRARDIRSKATSWPQRLPVPIYLIRPDGATQAIELRPAIGRPMAVFPTQAGLFWISNNTSVGRSEEAGGWILREGQSIKLFDHLVNGAGVSPDGCHIAYASQSRVPKALPWVTAINLCTEG